MLPQSARESLIALVLLVGLLGVTWPAGGCAAEIRDARRSELARTAQQAMLAIFRSKDPSAIDRYFGPSLLQHDPNIEDGLPGLRNFAAEVASSPEAGVTIYRTLVDGDFVLLHSRYEGLRHATGPLIAFDLFRFKDGLIVEHWGGQEPETPPNPSGRTQVDGPTAVVDEEQTEANRSLVRSFKEVVTVQLHYNRVGEFIEGDNYMQHASKVGDGVARMKSRVAQVVKASGDPVLQPRRYVADGNFVLALVEARTDSGHTANYDLFRVDKGKIVEHWDVISTIPPPAQRKNGNSPF